MYKKINKTKEELEDIKNIIDIINENGFKRNRKLFTIEYILVSNLILTMIFSVSNRLYNERIANELDRISSLIESENEIKYLLNELFVIEYNDKLYIINSSDTVGFYSECHNLFNVIINPTKSDIQIYDYESIKDYDGKLVSLFEYLKEDEIETIKKFGYVTPDKINKIEERINEQYKYENNKKTSKVKEYKYQNLWKNINA